MGRVLSCQHDLRLLAGAPNTSVFAHRRGAVIRQLVDSSNARICARICFRYSFVRQSGSASNRTARSTSKCAPDLLRRLHSNRPLPCRYIELAVGLAELK